MIVSGGASEVTGAPGRVTIAQLTIVDLRWGVTSAQSERGTALLRCLRELQVSPLLHPLC